MEYSTYASTIREALNNNEPLKAVFYGRVSTDNEGQKDSCENQLELCLAYLSEHPNITLVEKFIDEGETAVTSYNRERYNAMLERISQGDIDIIFTKSLHRLHRNEAAAYLFEYELVESQTTTFTLEDYQLQDYEDENTMLERSVRYSMNAQYSRQQRKSGLKVQELRCIKKILTAKDISLGYKWDKATKTISIDEDKRWIIEYIFEQYTFVQKNPADIIRDLKQKGVSISPATFKNIIQDERYIGKFYINKRTSQKGKGLNAKTKRIKLSKDKWVLIERPDLQIIDEELFDLAQRVRATRITIYEKPDKVDVQARFQGKHLFAGKVFCAECNRPYRHDYADRAKKIAIYKSNNHGECSNKNTRISEQTLIHITKQAIQMTLENKQKAVSHLKNILESCMKDSDSYKNEINRISKQITNLMSDIDNWSNALCDPEILSNTIVKRNLLDKVTKTQKQIDELSEHKTALEKSCVDSRLIETKISKVSLALVELTKVKDLTREKILNHVDKILIKSNGDIDVVLKTGMNYTFRAEGNLSSYILDDNVGKMAIQGALAKHLSDAEKPIYLSTFKYHELSEQRFHKQSEKEITVHCYVSVFPICRSSKGGNL